MTGDRGVFAQGRHVSRAEGPSDVSTNAERIARLEQLRSESLEGGGPVRIERQHAAGKLTARERLELLLDADSFVELDAFVTHRAAGFGPDEQRVLGDGVVTGHGTIDGRLVFVYSQDFTVFGGSLSEAYAEKICKIMDLAMKVGAPIVGLNDSGGARIQEGVASLGGYAEIFLRNVLASGVVPQISVILGPCAGGAVYSPAITDFTVMVEGTSYMFVTGPNVVRAVTHEVVDADALGGAAVHTGRSGVAHLAAVDEAEAMASVRRLLAHLPQNNLADAPLVETRDRATAWTSSSTRSSPTSPRKPYDMHDVLAPHRGRRATSSRSSRAGPPTSSSASPGSAGARRRRGAAAGGAGRRARHRRVREGRAIRPDVRRLQRAAGHVRRRAGFPARRRAGARRDHPPRCEAALCVLRGDGAQGDGHHAQGVRRRVRRHEQQAHPRRLQPRLAQRRDRGDGRRGRGEHHLQGSDRRRRRSRRGAVAPRRGLRGASSRIRTSPPGAATSTRSSSRARRGPGSSRALEMLADKHDTNPRKKHGNIPL